MIKHVCLYFVYLSNNFFYNIFNFINIKSSNRLHET